MAHVKIATDTLKRIRGELVKTAALEKEAQQLRLENDIYRRTMDLVAEGYLDPAVAIVKVAEFQQDPGQLALYEHAFNMGAYESTKLGTAIDDIKETPSDAGTPEGTLGRRIESVVDDYGLRSL